MRRAVQNCPVVPVAVPPPGTRFWFWTFGRRVEPTYRPWVAEQIADPRYFRRRLGPSIAMQVVLVVIPQALLAWGEHSRWRLIPPGGLLLFYAGYAATVSARRKQLSPAGQRRLRAYHGVTADGRVVPTISAFDVSPLGRVGFVLLCTQLVVFATGVVIVTDHVVTQRSCHELTAGDARALQAVIGEPVPAAAAAFGAPAPIVAAGTPLVAAREVVDDGFPGIRFVAAYVRDTRGRLIGPAVWRIIDPMTQLNPSGSLDVSAQESRAREITPSTGYGFSNPESAASRAARACAKSAR
ncbi:MAG: hypothetical protein QOJ79_2717 [Actinomycetota bacterium]|jgi:hypothetical protein|nr:hypothetical protein [Actinomycetota bacterium]